MTDDDLTIKIASFLGVPIREAQDTVLLLSKLLTSPDFDFSLSSSTPDMFEVDVFGITGGLYPIADFARVIAETFAKANGLMEG